MDSALKGAPRHGPAPQDPQHAPVPPHAARDAPECRYVNRGTNARDGQRCQTLIGPALSDSTRLAAGWWTKAKQLRGYRLVSC